ncbi:MAG: hypothetical protein OEZ06_01405 [Myxococcales bacterium]|nr:hypothetical protein [Myxococcales bacterium]
MPALSHRYLPLFFCCSALLSSPARAQQPDTPAPSAAESSPEPPATEVQQVPDNAAPSPTGPAGSEAEVSPTAAAEAPTETGSQAAPEATPPAPAAEPTEPTEPTTTSEGPVLDLPEDAEAQAGWAPPADAAPAADRPAAVDMTRGLKQARLDSPTGVGGYAELHYNLKNLDDDAARQSELDMHRLVAFLAKRFGEQLSFYAEIEVEHALAKPGSPGQVGIEQATFDYLLIGQQLGVRAGIVLVPMGIINQWHEPPIFHGVERPIIESTIIPSTWREGGVGIFGEAVEGLRYELYLVGGLNAAGFRIQDGIRGGRQSVANARADGLALTGRVELEPSLGVVAGISGYFGLAGPNADFYDAAGSGLELDVPVLGLSADVRGRYKGFEGRAVFAHFSIGDSALLRQAADVNGDPLGIDVGSRALGLYGEIAYDALHLLETEHQLLPFVRVERYDPVAAVDGREESDEDKALAATALILGLSYRPIPQVIFKFDFIRRNHDAGGDDSSEINLGVGTMF